MRTLPRTLAALPPGWNLTTDVVVIGSGIAGLTTALAATRAGRVLLVTKTHLDAGSTRWAQGGIAAALAPEDSPEDHLRDTLVAGAGLCDVDAVRVLVEEGPRRVHELVDLGTAFDRSPDGELALTREGGHHRDRIAHAGGDATGLEIGRALIAAVHADARIEVVEQALVLDLLKDSDGRAAGVTLHVLGEGRRDGVGAVSARAVVLASGGMGQLFVATTNPTVSTGDGVALALRAGAEVADLEFVQFHPTVLWLGGGVTGQLPLLSEALRGEGALLVDVEGERFMPGEHPLAELAPRDVVAKAITRRMHAPGSDHVLLDARHLGQDFLEARFPTVVAACRAAGFDPATQPVPVRPAAHYASGGAVTDLDGRTTVPGLWACGEVACTGVHGANRLASNSLLEGLVYGHRIADDLSGGLPPLARARQPAPGTDGLLPPRLRGDLQRAVTGGAGVIRSEKSLALAGAELAALARVPAREGSAGAWETTNLHTVATALVAAAALREETRGSHWREDFPDRDDVGWQVRIVTTQSEGGALETVRRPVSAHALRADPVRPDPVRTEELSA